jgi:hypothetical protein
MMTMTLVLISECSESDLLDRSFDRPVILILINDPTFSLQNK